MAVNFDELFNPYADCKKAQQSARNRNSRSRGLEFEGIIREACEFYRSSGIADAEKNSEPMKIIRRLSKGQFIACYTEKSQTDFQGIIKNGPALYFEAKHTDRDRMDFEMLREDQRERLQRRRDYGAITFILVSFGLRDFFRVPFLDWIDMKRLFGRKYMLKAELERYRIPYADVVVDTVMIGKHSVPDMRKILLFLDGIIGEDIKA